MDDTPNLRKKAWERAEQRGLATKIAGHVGVKPSSARRWLLPPGHPDRRTIKDDQVKLTLARIFDLQPNDFVWLFGERAKRKPRSTAISSAASRRAAAVRRVQRSALA